MIEVATHRSLALKGNFGASNERCSYLALIALKLLDDIWPIGENRCYHIHLYECVCVLKLKPCKTEIVQKLLRHEFADRQ